MTNLRSNQVYEMLHKAIKKKDKVATRNLMLRNARVRFSNVRGDTLLHWAIINFEDVDIMTMLLDRGANIYAKNHHHQKPLKVAIENNKIEAAQLLIKRGALRGEDLNGLLFEAIQNKNEITVKLLIDGGIQHNLISDFKIFLNVAISRGLPRIIEYIIPHCKFFQPSDKYIPRQVVVELGPSYQACVKLLLKWKFTVNPNSKNDEDFIYGAVRNGYTPIVLQLLKFGIDVNLVKSNIGVNLLKIACHYRHHQIVENLLKHNACVNVTTPTNTEVLHNLMINYRKYPFLLVLHTRTLQNITCLHIAVLNTDLKMMKLLLKYGAKIVDDPTFFNITCIAIRFNSEEIVRMFLDHGVNVNAIDCRRKSLLHFCVLPDDDEEDLRYGIAKLLLEKGANIHIETPGNSLIYDAIANRHRKTAQLFLDYNGDVQYISSNGNTLLHKAIENNFDVEFIKILLERNSPVNVVNNEVFTPLHLAFRIESKNPVKIIKTLLDFNANVDCTDGDMKTPLHLACGSQNLEAVRVLLSKGANLNVKEKRGQTPLHLVCDPEYLDSFLSTRNEDDDDMTRSIIQLLLQHNANIEAVDARGWTPLFVACYSGNEEAIECLLDNHANINHTDLDGLGLMNVAAEYYLDNPQVIKILLKHKVNLHHMDESGNSIIHFIAENDASELIEDLARTKINFNTINKVGNSALHIAVQQKSVAMVKNLVKYGANVNILNKNKCTALQNAMMYTLHYDGELMIIFKDIIKVLKTQVIKLKVAGLKVNNQNLKIVYDSDDSETSDDESTDEEDDDEINIPQLEIKCEQEMEEMRTERIGVHNMTFYDLLTKNIHILSRYVKNRRIRQTLEREVYDEKYPLYIDIIRSRFRDAKFRYRMMNSAKKYFTSTITQRLSDGCIDTVFSYLNIKELKMFIRAMKPLDG